MQGANGSWNRIAGIAMAVLKKRDANSGLGGIGEASYSSLGPAIIGDLFIGDARSKMLALFYLTTIFGRYLPITYSPSFKNYLKLLKIIRSRTRYV